MKTVEFINKVSKIMRVNIIRVNKNKVYGSTILATIISKCQGKSCRKTTFWIMFGVWATEVHEYGTALRGSDVWRQKNVCTGYLKIARKSTVVWIKETEGVSWEIKSITEYGHVTGMCVGWV